MRTRTKKLAKKTLKKAVSVSNRVLNKNPRLKSYVKRAVEPYLIRNIVAQDQYNTWLTYNFPDAITIQKMKTQSDLFEYRPLISIIVPTYNTDEQFLTECLESVQSQAYTNWELCIVDDASTKESVREIIKAFASMDTRIKYHFAKKNQHISAASNRAVRMAGGEFIALFDHDDMLWPNALYEVVKALNDDRDLDFIYSDEDKITYDRHHHALPFFKPDWNFDFLRSVNYITHFSVIRKSLFDQVGGFRGECNGAQDWDLFLRLSHASDKIHHVPTILYSWRISENSTAGSTDAKPYVVEAQKRALADDLARRGIKGSPRQNSFAKDYWTVDYDIEGEPLVSIVIPTKNQFNIVRRCIESILEKTTYRNYEIIIVDTGSTDSKVLKWYERITSKNQNIKIHNWHEQPFSYVRSCNFGAKQAKGDYLIMLNNDTEVITQNWIEQFLGYAQQEEVGAVGAKLYYPGGELIQHAGVGVGFGGYAANALAMLQDTHLTPQQHLYLFATHNMSAVTAACMMIKKSKYDQVGGFAEKFRITYNDVDLSLRLLEAGYRNVYCPEIRLIHHESISLGLPEEQKKRDTKEFGQAKALFKRTWRKYVDHDPAINPNIDKSNARFEVNSTIQRYK